MQDTLQAYDASPLRRATRQDTESKLPYMCCHSLNYRYQTTLGPNVAIVLHVLRGAVTAMIGEWMYTMHKVCPTGVSISYRHTLQRSSSSCTLRYRLIDINRLSFGISNKSRLHSRLHAGRTGPHQIPTAYTGPFPRRTVVLRLLCMCDAIIVMHLSLGKASYETHSVRSQFPLAIVVARQRPSTTICAITLAGSDNSMVQLRLTNPPSRLCPSLLFKLGRAVSLDIETAVEDGALVVPNDHDSS